MLRYIRKLSSALFTGGFITLITTQVTCATLPANTYVRSVTINYEKTPTVNDMLVNKRLTVGDMHGNTLTIINILIQSGILTAPDIATPYNGLKNIIKQASQNELTLEQYNLFKNYLKIFTVHETTYLRFLGDILADRRSNDALTLALFSYLYAPVYGHPANIDIVYSNHDNIFFNMMYTGPRLDYLQARSGNEAISFLSRNPQLAREINDHLTLYVAHLYMFMHDPYTGHLYSHAFLTPKTLSACTEAFNPFIDEEDLTNKQKIDMLNVQFRFFMAAVVTDGSNQTYFLNTFGRTESLIGDLNKPCYFALWHDRNLESTAARYRTTPEKLIALLPNGHPLVYFPYNNIGPGFIEGNVHGHTDEVRGDNLDVTLNHNVGKSDFNEGVLPIEIYP